MKKLYIINRDSKSTLFNYEEKLFVEKYAYGFNKQEIKDEICMGCEDKFLFFKQGLKKKLNVDSDIHMVKESYNINLFEININFIINQKHIALGIAYNIYMSKKNENPISYYSMTLKELYEMVNHLHAEIITDYKLRNR